MPTLASRNAAGTERSESSAIDGHQRCDEDPDRHSGDEQVRRRPSAEQGLDEVGPEEAQREEAEHDARDAGETSRIGFRTRRARLLAYSLR
jgi:hypothetical protein